MKTLRLSDTEYVSVLAFCGSVLEVDRRKDRQFRREIAFIEYLFKERLADEDVQRVRSKG